MNPANANPLGKKPAKAPLSLTPEEYQARLLDIKNRVGDLESSIRQYIEQEKMEALRPTLPRAEFESQMKAKGLADVESSAQRVRDIMMMGKGKESRPIWDTIMGMRGEMMESEAVENLLGKKEKKSMTQQERIDLNMKKVEKYREYAEKRKEEPLSVLTKLYAPLTSLAYHAYNAPGADELIERHLATAKGKEKQLLQFLPGRYESPRGYDVADSINFLKAIREVSKNYSLGKYLDTLQRYNAAPTSHEFLDSLEGLSVDLRNYLDNRIDTDDWDSAITNVARLYEAIEESKDKDEIKLSLGDDENDVIETMMGGDYRELMENLDLVDTEYEDVEGDTDTPEYIRKDILENRLELDWDLPYDLLVRRKYSVQYEKQYNEETDEWDYDEDEDGEDYYPDDEYFLVRKK